MSESTSTAAAAANDETGLEQDNTPDQVSASGSNEEQTAQIAVLKDQVLRALADAENTRRRGQKELEDTRKYAVSSFARDILNVADNFSRALEAMPKDIEDAGVKNLITGLEATERQLQASLDRFGIKKMNPVGQPFDPNFHRVMMEMESTDHPAGTIVQVLQPGYVIHDRLLREALVAIAKPSATSSKVDTSV